MVVSRLALAGVFALILVAAPGAQQPSSGSGPGVDAALRIYLARHGETASNVERRVVGQLDEPLNARGREQARRLRDTLAGVALDAIYASPLARSLETAAIVADGRPIRVIPKLMERNQGGFQGLLADSAADFARRMRDPADHLGGGETTYELKSRSLQALETVRRLHSRGAVLIVGHYLVNQMLVGHMLELPVELAMEINQSNDELYLFELRNASPARSWKQVRSGSLGEL